MLQQHVSESIAHLNYVHEVACLIQSDSVGNMNILKKSERIGLATCCCNIRV